MMTTRGRTMSGAVTMRGAVVSLTLLALLAGGRQATETGAAAPGRGQARPPALSARAQSVLAIDRVDVYRSVNGTSTVVTSAHLGETIGFAVSYHASADMAARVVGTLRFARDGRLTPPQAMTTASDASGRRFCYIWLAFAATAARRMVPAVEVRFELRAGGLSAQRSLTLAVAAATAPVQPGAGVTLPPLTPRPGYVIGRAIFADGRPIPRFSVEALGFDGQAHLSSGGLPFLGQTQGLNGRYALRTMDTVQQQRPVNALVRAVQATTRLSYHGDTYVLALYPLDGQPDGTGRTDFRGNSGPGVVRDFMLTLSGLKPGFASYRGQETSTTDSATGAFYGGNLIVFLGTASGSGSALSAGPGGSTVTLTLVPTGPLVDGSAGGTVTRPLHLVAGQTNGNFYLHSIPIGVYTATARWVEPSGAAHDLRLQAGPGAPWQSAARIAFTPTDALPDGSASVTLSLAP